MTIGSDFGVSVPFLRDEAFMRLAYIYICIYERMRRSSFHRNMLVPRTIVNRDTGRVTGGAFAGTQVLASALTLTNSLASISHLYLEDLHAKGT